ncbi:hypothetical protein HDU67_002947 [Dinochytrium kinnereticum]|nr:hypothetical protein HDU67_002947 [Dinochytrium kinnereticum]
MTTETTVPTPAAETAASGAGDVTPMKRKQQVVAEPEGAVKEDVDGVDEGVAKKSKVEVEGEGKVVEKVEEEEEEEEEDDVSIYPDTQEFYAWLSADGPSGAFLACHGVDTMDEALAVFKGRESEPTEKVKERCDDAIDNAYCITLGEGIDGEDERELGARRGEVWDKVVEAGNEKRWMRVRVAREREEVSVGREGEEEKRGVVGDRIVVADLDPREGLIIPKISGWRFLVGVESVGAEVSEGIQAMMLAHLS